MPEKPPNTGRASSDPTELERAVGACRSAFTVCAVFSLAINLLMLVSPIYMLQVYDRVLTTGRVETLLMLTLIATIISPQESAPHPMLNFDIVLSRG